MDAILQFDAWLLSLLLYILMFFSWWIGFVKFSRDHKQGESTRNQVPGSIILMLVIFAVNASFMMGRFTPTDYKMSSSAFRMGVYILLVVLVFDVTIDLEQPRRGLMRVSQAPMQDLLTTLTAK